jgi:hypothetical protein
MIAHPLSVDTDIVYDTKQCNCLLKKKKPGTAKIARVMKFNGVIWYVLDNGQQIHQKKVIKVVS